MKSLGEITPYSEYQKIGLPWLEQIPEHWQLIKTKHLFRERNEKGYPDEPLLAATQTKGVVRKEQYENRTVLALKDLQLLKLVRVGDFVISLRSFQGGIEITHEQGIISPAYTILYPKKTVNSQFFAKLFKSKPYIENLTLFVTGIRQGQNIDYERLSRSYLPVPPVEEQAKIAQFITHFDSRISRLIRAKRRLIALLNEQKQAIIQQAVTRGLDPHVRLKPSGVEWLGDIPEHWEILPGKACFKEKKIPNTGLKIKKVLSLSYGKIIVKPEEKLHGLVPAFFETYQIIDKDDIIVRPTDLQNDHTSLRFGLSTEIGIITSAYMCLNTEDILTSEYGYLLLHTYDLIKIIYRLGSGLRQNLSWEDFKYLPCIVPPLSEQISIADYINTKNHGIDTQIERYKHELTLLNEYRTRLIADVVTGKLDVRGVELPALDEAELGESLTEEPDELPDEALEAEFDAEDGYE